MNISRLADTGSRGFGPKCVEATPRAQGKHLWYPECRLSLLKKVDF